MFSPDVSLYSTMLTNNNNNSKKMKSESPKNTNPDSEKTSDLWGESLLYENRSEPGGSENSLVRNTGTMSDPS